MATGAWDTSATTEYYELQIVGESFVLEIAANTQTRLLGYSGRGLIDANGRTVFVFPKEELRSRYMGDCVIPIDIAFLDSGGAVTATYTMEPEGLRSEAESGTAYENRLKRFTSRSPAEYAVELRAGTIN